MQSQEQENSEFSKAARRLKGRSKREIVQEKSKQADKREMLQEYGPRSPNRQCGLQQQSKILANTDAVSG